MSVYIKKKNIEDNCLMLPYSSIVKLCNTCVHYSYSTPHINMCHTSLHSTHGTTSAGDTYIRRCYYYNAIFSHTHNECSGINLCPADVICQTEGCVRQDSASTCSNNFWQYSWPSDILCLALSVQY